MIKQFLLYKTRNRQFSDKKLETNCFYYSGLTFDRVYTLVPYCFRSSDNFVYISSMSNGISFEDLYKRNITSKLLLKNFASIDTIEDYEIYWQKRQLNLNTNDSDKNLYFICDSLSFGIECQYHLIAKGTIRQIINELNKWKKTSNVSDILAETHGTCIEGIQCDGRDICLDWREICNGHVDCLNYKDEEFCNELEINECDPQTEYRCSNGLCISHHFFYDLIPDCLDKSDESEHDLCFDGDMAWTCENAICGDDINQFEAFHQRKQYVFWKDVFTVLQIIFGGCSLPGLMVKKDSDCSHLSLFHCQNSSKCISKYRLQDNIIDCYNNTDEDYNDTCDLALPHRFQCKSEKRCIPRRLFLDFSKHCIDGSDESLTTNCQTSFSESCDILAGRKEINQIVSFADICDGIERIQPTYEDKNTDETDCNEYSCVSEYTLCDGQMNCPDGRDEIFCENTVSTLICNIDKEQTFCVQQNGSVTNYCASMNVIGDQKVDCLGSSDERDHCRIKYPYEFNRRYRCLNDSTCITPHQICDCHADCPLKDDESYPLCPWKSGKCNPEILPCQGDMPIIFRGNRCNGIFDCYNYLDEWLCDLLDRPSIDSFKLQRLSYFKPILPQNLQRSLNLYTYRSWYCNRGMPIRFIKDPEHFQCLCPPAYYGNRCEYQRKRLNLILELNAPTLIERTSIFKLIVFLIETSNYTIVSQADEIIYLPSSQCLPKHIIDLLYPIKWRYDIKHYVHIQIYRLTNSFIEYRGSWFFSIKFEFLYVNRIASQIMLLEKNSVKNCQNLPCLHGLCELYLNFPEHSFCHCESGWSGRLCNIKHLQECDCAPQSLCVSPGTCICPLYKIGSRCYIDFNPCIDNPCGKHGICVSLDIQSIRSYCFCDEGYFGRRCEQISSHLKVKFSSSIIIPSAILVHFITLFDKTDHQTNSYFKRIRLYESETDVFYPMNYLPTIIFIQLIIEKNSFPLYLVFRDSFQTPLLLNEITIEITNSNRCPHINEFFDKDFPYLPYLYRVKFYQRPCRQKNENFLCFYDNIQICFCNQFNETECFPFISMNNTAQCTNEYNPCENNGQCIQDKQRCPTTSICLCPECTFGSLCQFNTRGYIFSLNTIIGPYIKPNISLINQSKSILIGLIICFMIGYFISYLPYILTSIIFILPSTIYKKQLSTLLKRFV
ncbi:hypothetical protein I4U23_017082 [Adineta vaga]|nr:hypothetical protein I4U23_017082 [Adineta vaga]